MSAARSAPRPTLAILSPSREDAGAERYLSVIAQACVERGWSVHAGIPPLGATARLRERLRESGVICHPLALARQPASIAEVAWFTAADARRALGLLRRVRPASVLVVLPHPDQAPGLVLAASLYPARAIASVQLVPTALRLTPARRLLYRTSLRLGVGWLALSGHSRRRLAEELRLGEDEVRLICNGVGGTSAPRSRNGSRLRRRVREELEVPADAKLILSVGRLNAQKGYDLIAESIPGVAREHPDAWWVWAGEGPARDSLTRQLERLGASERVRMLGARDDVPTLLATADLFVLASRDEGSPFAVLEALGSGLPVIVSDAGPLPEIVRDGVDGRVVAAQDPVALSGVTSWALEHRREMRAMAAAGRKRVLAEFSAQRMVQETLALLSPAM